MSRPKIAIVGRPNVGKSALFNRIVGKRIAIVDEAEGVTRDRLYGEGEHFGRFFTAIDTGGIHSRSTALFNEDIKLQAQVAIEEADSIIVVVDGQIGLTLLDEEVAKILHRTKKPVILAVNKVDSPDQTDKIAPFYALGFKDPVPVSASHGWQIAELLDRALDPLPKTNFVEETPDCKIAIIGRPNVGKSSLINKILNDQRCIVSNIPGTTRDSIDIPLKYDDKQYTLIDTAGIRNKKSEKEAVDKFALIRAERALERCDICLVMIDIIEGLTRQEKRILNLVEEAGKPCILLINKWDLNEGVRMEHYKMGVEGEASFLEHCPKIFISALNGRNLDKIFPEIDATLAQNERITTHKLNNFMIKAMQRNHPAMIKGKRLRVYYMTQISQKPPTFLLFINYPELMQDSYKRYLIKQFRQTWPLKGYPIRFDLKKRLQKSSRDGDVSV
jgi:GTP-binding protein